MSEKIENVQPITETEMNEVNQTVDLDPKAAEEASILSFDELDQLTDGRTGEELVGELKKESKTEKDKPEVKAEDNDEEAEKGSEEEQGEAEVFEEEIKKLIAKSGESDIEISANAIFNHKVDGEDVDVELQELLNNYSGKISYDRKFQELSEKNKNFKSEYDSYVNEKNQIREYINTFNEKIKNEDAMGALEYIAGFSGMEPLAFRRELLNQLTPIIMDRANMTPEQIEADDLAAQNAYLRQKYESVQEQQREEQALKELESEIANVQEAQGISEDDFSNAYEELLETGYEGDITPQAVGEFYAHMTAFSKAEEILGQVSPMLAEQEEIVDNLQSVIVENPSFDNDDLLEIVQEVYGDVKKEVSQKVSRKAEAPKKQIEKKSSKENYVDFEDL